MSRGHSMNLEKVLGKYRDVSYSEANKGYRFEKLIQAFLQTTRLYTSEFEEVWLWQDFFAKGDFGGRDVGIDLVALTYAGEYWAIQCKFYGETNAITKSSVDSFLSTAARSFTDRDGSTIRFSHRLFVSTTNKWSDNAREAFNNQDPPCSILNLHELEEAPVDWELLDEGISGQQARTPGKTLYPHQQEALEKAHEYYKTKDRGKLIMACGTGKTFNVLRIAEHETNGKGLILFLVPSIALLGQALREWAADAKEDITPICICSDPTSSSAVDLARPASTDTDKILSQFKKHKERGIPGMTVVFSTYQSIDVISKAQKRLMETQGFGEFDLIICDEAHRTTGVSLAGEDESAFVKVHDNDFLKAKRRLYMTATPRLYSEDSKEKAEVEEAYLCSMDDPNLYGEEMYRIGFGEAVEEELLSDYKVLILTINEETIPPGIQEMIAGDDYTIDSDDVTKLIGCISALSKQVIGDDGALLTTDPAPMKRAVAFTSRIVISKQIKEVFNTVTESYIDTLPESKKDKMVSVAAEHIDGTMSAQDRDKLLSWLKKDEEENECRIITNVRCLSEGVDVPSLDAVMFLSARNSQVDVVQSVGRVMRKSKGKNYGYIIIPIVIPFSQVASEALDKNEPYKVVWTVLNALRAHDDRFNAIINKIDLNKNKPASITIGQPDIIAEPGAEYDGVPEEVVRQLEIQFEKLQDIIYAKMVKKVGTRTYWEQWAQSVAEIAQRQITRIEGLIKESRHKAAFNDFLSGLQKNINPATTQKEAIEMLSQHIITKPVFDALFKGYSFVESNAISQSMQKMLDLLEEQTFRKDAEQLEKFYSSVRRRAEGIDNAEGRQRIIIELYDKFFRTAFPKMVEQLGIVYTPVEVVDFIIFSINDVLKQEFGRSISDENIHILDPFTGTGTFITRLLQSGLIKEKDLKRKYKQELHANEIVLLAYYIAAVNIENAYHDQTSDPADGIGKEKYTPFDGIVLTDTFQLGETDESQKLFSEMFPQNSERVVRQKKAPLRVIIGNPPYSRGQEDANDFAQNQEYKKLEKRISETYAIGNTSTLSRDLYNSYMKAFRWASDRLDKEGGVIAFVTGSGFIDKGSYTGFRKSLEQEFSSVFIYNLRGDIRGRSKEDSRREGQNVFDIMTGVAITILVKKPNNKKAEIFYKQFDDYLTRKDKLKFLTTDRSIAKTQLDSIKPNEVGDWINQRSGAFEDLFELAPKKNFNIKSKSVFTVNPVGVSTNRDDWTCNFSKTLISKNMSEMCSFYNVQVKDYRNALKINTSIKIDDFISNDLKKIKWTAKLKNDLLKGTIHTYSESSIIITQYRPFAKCYLYYDKNFIERPGIFDNIFPTSKHDNLIITTPGKGGRKSFCSLITANIPNLNNFDGGTQCFPLYYYEERKNISPSLFDSASENEFIRRDGVSDFILERAKKQYGKNVIKEDIFYYVYGILHSPEYRETFANDLKKMLPRIPLVDEKDFWAFSKAGRELAEYHIYYENVPPYLNVVVTGADSKNYIVNKMRFPKKDGMVRGKKKRVNDKSTINYNASITIENIPEKAYEYVVNGKSAIEWIMERYQVKTDKKSGIKNDPNDWAKEVGNPRYILDLLLSIITVSVKTVDIVNSLPKIDFGE